MQIELKGTAWRLLDDKGAAVDSGIAATRDQAISAAKERSIKGVEEARPTPTELISFDPAAVTAAHVAADRERLQRGLESNLASIEEKTALIVQFQQDIAVIQADVERIQLVLGS